MPPVGSPTFRVTLLRSIAAAAPDVAAPNGLSSPARDEQAPRPTTATSTATVAVAGTAAHRRRRAKGNIICSLLVTREGGRGHRG
ncbi:hypothetical protein FrEUN1fDRAFT_6427 [Parafrankia sp. EUN1f]|nr:hypothetical protein FrEUN1fDRAFT_6427 [Parafrankia sp. EUN1f]